MKNSKRVIAFLIAVAASGMNMPMVLTGINGIVTYAETANQYDIRITGQPESFSGSVGDEAVFRVVAEGSNLKYQWKVITSINSSWINTGLTGNKTNQLTVPVISSRNGYQFCCTITDDNGNEVVTDTVSLVLDDTVVINKQPINYLGNVNNDAIFEVNASGLNLKYQWKVKTAPTADWKNTSFSGNSSNKLTVPIIRSRDGYRFCCVITDKNGKSVTTNEVVLKAAASITQQPVNFTGDIGEDAVFNVLASGNDVKYQWKVLTPGASDWKNTGLTGNKTNKLTVPITAARNGYQFCCAVTDAYGTYILSDTVTLNVGSKPNIDIIKQPISVITAINNSAYFSVVASGNNLKYQWKVKTMTDSDWKATGMSGNKTSTLTVPAIASRDGYQFCCVITDNDGNILTSDAATLNIASPITFTNPESATITPDSQATYTIQAAGTGNLTYEWESSTDGSTWISIPNSNNATLTVDGATAVSGTQYRCTVSDAYGQSKTSEPATLTVESASKPCGDNLTYTYKNGTLNISELSRVCNISRTTAYKYLLLEN